MRQDDTRIHALIDAYRRATTWTYPSTNVMVPAERHACAWPGGCSRLVRSGRWGCRSHWRALSPRFRTCILRTWRRDDEGYRQVIEEVKEWIQKT